ncbi:MAG TPA: HEAT repeat domain-containing protein [Kofleriaceae bacterium]|nr:HEAT repeat domain-containing protein [Kofleriaceae bacterium]
MRAAIAALAAAVAIAAAAAPAHAQAEDTPALIKLIENQPADMDRTAWKEKRRDAARKLGQGKDRRAVPALMKLAEAETFDIIGEIAIEGLGNLGDPAAVPVLQKIANDPARDKAQRDLAVKALGKLGASATGGTGTGGAGTGDTGAGDTGTGGTDTGAGDTGTGTGDTGTGSSIGSALLGEKPAAGLPALPELPEDVLAASERLTFAAGTANLAYDTVRNRSSFDADIAGLYQKRIDRERMAWGWNAGAHVIAGFINPRGREQTRGAQVTLDGDADVRYYAGGRFYFGGKAALGTQVNYIADLDDDAGNDFKDAQLTLDAAVALVAGYGRVIDVGGAIRVRRLSRTLDAARALGRPITPELARRLELTWWALRRERSSYRALVATVAILREAGVLLGEPDAGLTYEILNVLRDAQLFARPSGLDLQLGIAESFLVRPGEIGDGTNTANEDGRVEQLLFAAGYGLQAAEDTLELSGTSYGRLRVLAPDDPRQPSPWAFGATARVKKLTYGDHGDPFGAIDVVADLKVSNDNRNAMGDNQTGMRLGGQLGFTYWLDQASGVRIAATGAIDSGELFLGVQLQATYGLLDATFAGL